MDATVLLCMLSAVARVLFCVCLSVLRGFIALLYGFLGVLRSALEFNSKYTIKAVSHY